MKNIIVAASIAASLFSSVVFAGPNAKEGDMNITIRAQGLQKEGSTIVTKKRGYGAELELAYFMNNNVAGVFGVGYNKFKQRIPLAGANGIKATYVPFKLGIQYHGINPNGFNPYFGLGYKYTNGNYKRLDPTLMTMQKRNLHGGYVEIGSNFYMSDEVALNVNVQKTFMRKNALLTYSSLSPATVKVKYNPLELGVGVTFGGIAAN